MKQQRRGKFYITLVSKYAMQDIHRYNIPDDVAEYFIEEFHAMGDYAEPEDYWQVQRIARQDCRRLDAYRLKTRDPQLRGFVLLFEHKHTSKQSLIVLAGIFIRDEYTYESTLTRRLIDLEMK